MARAAPLEGHPDGACEYWWEPCDECNDEARRVPEPPEEEPYVENKDPFGQLALQALEENRRGETTSIEEEMRDADPVRANFGLLVRKARTRAGLTAAQAAKASLMSQPYWLDIENNQRNPPHEGVVRKMAAALGVDAPTTSHWVLTAGWAHVPECWRREVQRMKRFMDRQDEMRQERDERAADRG